MNDFGAKCCGNPSTDGELILRAGAVSLAFDPAALRVHHLKVGQTTVLASVYVALRDENWGTLQPETEVREVSSSDDGFRVEFESVYGGDSPSFCWKATITGDAGGNIDYDLRGIPLRPLTTNRAGFCVLHPSSVAGLPCVVAHRDAPDEKSHFPRPITPHQPFMNITGIGHSPAQGIEVQVRLEGELFEMEDQRNWSDASFKTYCRPLDWDFPYTLNPGDEVRQRVSIAVTTTDGARTRGEAETHVPDLVVDMPGLFHRLPQVGHVRHSEESPRSADEVARAQLKPAFLRVDLTGSVDHQLQRLKAALEDAVAFQCRLLCGVCLDSPADASAFVESIRGIQHLDRIDWLPMKAQTRTSTRDVFEAFLSGLKQHGLPGRVGCGTSGSFVQMNRLRPVFDGAEFVSCAVSPQFHDFDLLSIVETLGVQPLIVEELAKMGGGLPVYMGPVTLLPYYNPAATAGGLAPATDDRQNCCFGAAWTIGCLAAMTAAGAEGVAVHCLSGHQGILRGGEPFTPTPLLHAMREVETAILAASSGAAVLDPSTGVNCGLVLQHHDRRILWMANLSPEPRALILKDHSAPPDACLSLTEEGWTPSCSSDPLPGWGCRQLHYLK